MLYVKSATVLQVTKNSVRQQEPANELTIETCCRWRCRPVVVEVPHFASLRDGEREISILRSEDGQTWKPHVQAASDSHRDVQDVIKATTGGMRAMHPTSQ